MYNCDAGIVPGFKKGILKETCKKLIWQNAVACFAYVPSLPRVVVRGG